MVDCDYMILIVPYEQVSGRPFPWPVRDLAVYVRRSVCRTSGALSNHFLDLLVRTGPEHDVTSLCLKVFYAHVSCICDDVSVHSDVEMMIFLPLKMFFMRDGSSL